MKISMKRPLTSISLGILAVAVAVGVVVAQPPPIQITSVVGEIPDANIKVRIKEPTVVSEDRLTFQPGAATPWHYHPGPAFVVVGTGAITKHEPDGCVRVFAAGSAFFEEPGSIHQVSNETGEVVEILGTLLLPAGSPPLVVVPEPPPAVCGSKK